MSEQDVVLEVEGITKRFPGVLANDDVNLQLRRGEILALLGENGAGKSTLMNIIYGLYHPDQGTIRIKGREVRFASPREAIHSGIGMVHQHFQLIPVMTVAENVVLGEEGDVSYQGRDNPLLNLVFRRLPSLLVFLACVILGIALGKWEYVIGGAVFGAFNAVVVALPQVARVLWGLTWRVGLAFIAIWVATRIELITRVGFTAVALRQEVEMIDEDTEEMEGYTVKITTVQRERISFDWRKEARNADGIEGVIESALVTLEEYRDNGVPGWLIDAIDDVPPVVKAISEALLLVLFGMYSVRTWRGTKTMPGQLEPLDLAVFVALAALYSGVAWVNLDSIQTGVRIGLLVLTLLGLGYGIWHTLRYRAQLPPDHISPVSGLDGAIDSLMTALDYVSQIRNTRAATQRVRDLSRQYGLEVDPNAVIEKLPVGTQQRVEIIKALYRQADILILDEPTAVLTPQEGQELFKIMRNLAAQGVSIIFITHKLKEVFEVATRIVVMRGGRVVGATTCDQATEASLAAMMVGREVILQVEKDDARPAGPVLEVQRLHAYNDRGAKALNEVSFAVQAGEVLGIAGVQGNGQTELVEVLTGLRKATGGSVKLLGMELQPDVQPEGSMRPRAIAFVIDMVIVGVLAYLLGYFVRYFGESTFDDMSTTSQVLAGLLITIIVDALYFLGSWKTAGATIGMSLFSLQVATNQDAKPALPALVARYLIFLALRLPLFLPALTSYLMATRHPQQRNWFDERLGLRVIRREQITPRRIKDAGTSHVPEDRQRHGLVKDYSVSDNLVLNDYYLRPYSKEPNVVELPFATLRYALVFGLIVAGLTALGLYLWNNGLWEAILDSYDVPQDMRTYALDTGMGSEQTEILQGPFTIAIVTLILAELVFGLVAHLITSRILGADQVQAMYWQLTQRMRRALAQNEASAEAEGGLLRDQIAIDHHASTLIERFDIRTPSTDTSGGSLSGGNQQKMIVAREFSRKPRLLIAAQPTRGIDVGSIEFIHRQIIDQRDEGAAVLLVSAELDEIMALSDRIAVMYKGEIIDTVEAKGATREQLGLLMAGIHNGHRPSQDAVEAASAS